MATGFSRVWQVYVLCTLFRSISSSGMWNNNYYLSVFNRSSTDTDDEGNLLLQCEMRKAQFGKDLPADGSNLWGCAVPVEPPKACSGTVSPRANDTKWCYPAVTNPDNGSLGRVFGLALRGNCTFGQKAYTMQSVGQYSGVIFINDDNSLNTPGPDNDYSTHVTVPVLLVNRECGEFLRNQYRYDSGDGHLEVLVTRRRIATLRWLTWLLHSAVYPTLVFMGLLLIIILSQTIVKCVRNYRKKARQRISKRNLNKIPVKKYIRGEEPDTCSICLEEFQSGEKLRVLPCSHIFHQKCIDPWLLKRRRNCPVCKRKVIRINGDSSSDSDAPGPSNPSPAPAREREPLLQPRPLPPGYSATDSACRGARGRNARRGRVVPGYTMVTPGPVQQEAPTAPPISSSGHVNVGFQEDATTDVASATQGTASDPLV